MSRTGKGLLGPEQMKIKDVHGHATLREYVEHIEL